MNRRFLLVLFVITVCALSVRTVRASHSMGADIAYRFLGGSSYEITLTFYRDCYGVPAPTIAPIRVRSNTCNFDTTYFSRPVPGTGQEITPICQDDSTTCNGGTYTGIQEWVYKDTIILPQACTDWLVSFYHCCRNAAITNITNPGSTTFYVYANINNVAASVNHSPVFSNKPIPFVCVGQQYCFSHGAVDPDGDSLSYSLIRPLSDSGIRVIYAVPFDSSQALTSSPAITFNSSNGDICMTPQNLEVTVMAVLVKEYRNGVLIGSVERDLQIIVTVCTNILPTITGMNGSSSFADTICADLPYCFTISSGDTDSVQTTSITWDTAIAAASFFVISSYRSAAGFCWTPTQADISNTPHCFTVTVQDDNCPYFGIQTYSYCLTVSGVDVNAGSDTTANCNSNVILTATGSGGTGPYNYQWSTGQTGNSIPATSGTYSVDIYDGLCSNSDTVNVLPATGVPVAAFSYAGNCSFTLVNFQDNSNVTGGTITTRTWNFGDGNTGSGTNPSHTYASPGNYTVQLIVVTSNGCTDTLQLPVTTGGGPPVTAFSAPSVCEGAATQFTDQSVAMSGNIVSWQWNFGDGNNSGMPNPPHTYSSQGNYPATLITINSSGCSDTATLNVVVNPRPTAYAGTDVSICDADGTTLTATGGGNYSWSPGTNFSNTYNVSPAFTTTYTVTVSNAFGCQASDQVRVMVNPNPVAAFNSANVCAGATSVFTNQSQAGSGTITSWQWNFGDGNISVSPSPTHLYISSGSYPIQLIVQDSAGCGDTLNSNHIVYPNPVASAGNEDTICAGENTMLSAAGGSNYNWMPGSVNAVNYLVSPVSSTIYTVTVTSQYGCQSTDAVRVQVNQNPTAAFTASPVCHGLSSSFSNQSQPGAGTNSYQWNFGDGMNSSAQSPSHAYAVSGNYSVRLIAQNTAGCIDTIISSYNVYPRPTANAGSDDTICKNQNTLLTAGGSGNYIWTPGGSSASAITVSPAATTTYTLTVSNNFGCQSGDQVTVVVNSNPVAAFAVPAVCEGIPSAFMNQSQPVSGTLGTTQWSFGDGNNSSQASPMHLYADSGNYSVMLIVQNSFGCRDTSTAAYAVNPNPVANAGTDIAICENGQTALNATGGGNYVWMPGSISSANYMVSPATTSGYSVAVTNVYGCVDTDSVVVQVNPNPVASIAAANVCEGFTSAFTDQSQTSSGNLSSWQWNFGDGDSSSVSSPYHMYSGSGNYIVSLRVRNSFTCSDTVNVTYTVYPKPVAGAGNDVSVCLNDSALLSATGSGNYVWSPGAVAAAAYLVVPSATTIYTLTVANSFGCVDIDEVTVVVNPNPVSSFAANLTVCAGESISFSNQSGISNGSITASQWNFGNGFQSTLQSPAFVYLQSANYPVMLTVTSDSGCVSTFIDTAFVKPNPVASFLVQNVCDDQPALFVSTSTVTSGAAMTYDWSFSNGNTSTGTNPILTFNVAGNYTANLVVTANGCSGFTTGSITVHPSPAAVFNQPGVCEKTSLAFNNQSVISSGSIVSWNWNFGDLGTSAFKNPLHTYVSSGQYPVMMIAQSDKGCLDTTTSLVIVNPRPVAALTGEDVCLEENTQFTDLSSIASGSITGWNWNLGDGSSSNIQNPFRIYTHPGIFSVLLTVTSDSGCISVPSQPLEVTVFDLPHPDFIPSRYIVDDLFAQIEFTNLTPGDNSYLWNFGDGTSSPDFSPTHTFPFAGSYEIVLVATTIHGCINRTLREVEVKSASSLYIPNSFTPNGDGRNDDFRPVHYNYSYIHGDIFDRWGELIFSWTGTDEGWNGITNGKPAPLDVYVYRITAVDINNKKNSYIGKVTLVR